MDAPKKGQVWERKRWLRKPTRVEVLGYKCFWFDEMPTITGKLGIQRVAIRQDGELKVIDLHDWHRWASKATLVKEADNGRAD